MLPIRTILCPTDFSATSDAALRLAQSIARDYDAKLFVLHVAEFPPPLGAEGVLLYPADYDLSIFQRQLDEIPLDPEIAMERCFVQGMPIEEILDFAERRKCDLIVLGTHGRTGVGRFFMGSVAEQIIRKAPCAVLSVKAATAAAKKPVEEAGVAVEA